VLLLLFQFHVSSHVGNKHLTMTDTYANPLFHQHANRNGNRLYKIWTDTNSVPEEAMKSQGALFFIRMLLMIEGIEQNPGPIWLNFWIFQFGYVTDAILFVLVFTAVVAAALLVLIRSLFTSADPKVS